MIFLQEGREKQNEQILHGLNNKHHAKKISKEAKIFFLAAVAAEPVQGGRAHGEN